MMQAPPTNALERHTMQQRLIAVPLPGRDRFAEDLFKARFEQITSRAAGWTRASIWSSSVPAGL